MKIVAGSTEQELVLGVPLIVGVAIVPVQPDHVPVPVDVQDVRVAVRVHLCEKRRPTTAL